MKTFRFTPLIGATLLLVFFGHSTCLGQGSLTPPGPPGPTMKTLDQLDAKLEKRTPISILPYIISASGSYYVTGNLTGLSGQNGITVTASEVRVDLNGFSLTGVAGAKMGIAIIGGVSGVSVSNGSVNGWPSGGVSAFDTTVPSAPKNATGCRFTALHLSGNTSDALNSGYASLVRDCIAEKNDGVGIRVGVGSTVEHCNANGNTGANGYGFLTYFAQQGGSGGFGPSVFNSCNATGNAQYGFFVTAAVLTDCVAYNNAKTGISADYSTLRSCRIYGNQSSGVLASSSNAEGCISSSNGTSGSGSGFTMVGGSTATNCTADGNAADGFQVGSSGGTVTACLAVNNGGSGFNLTTGVSASGCTAYSNNGDGIKVSSACDVTHCNADSNGLAGIHATLNDNRIQGNKVTNNANGIKVDLTVNLIYGNTARGNGGSGGNYSIITGNRVGTIVIPSLSGTVTGNAGAAGFGSTDPWANIAF